MVSESRFSRNYLIGICLFASLFLQVATGFTSPHGGTRHVYSKSALGVNTYAPWADTAESIEYEKRQERVQEQIRRIQERQREQMLNLQQQKQQKTVAKHQVQQTMRTLYDVLGAPKNATRAELKESYVMLAKQTHPDAMIGRDGNSRLEDDFGDVAAAWRTLSNTRSRQKYDRQLRAKEFAVEVENVVTEMSKRTIPVAMHAVETYVVPTFLKTATTVMASTSAAADEWKNTGDVGSAFVSAVKAGRRAVREVDMHLLQAAAE